MDTAALNSLDLYKQFEEINIPEKQARLFANLFARAQKTEDLATKSDVEKDFKTLEVSQDRKFDQVRHEISEVRHELREESEKIRHEIDSKINSLRVDMTRWMVGIFFAQASLVIGLKIFGH